MKMVLASGLLLGLYAGLAPGPLLALVLSQTLRYGAREGCKVALTPLITDAPIIAVALAVAANAAAFRPLLGIISIAGGLFVLYLAWDNLRVPNPDAQAPAENTGSWVKGIVANLLNPHPWLFWLTVGAATLARSMAQSTIAAVAFVGGFYLMLVGSKVVIALLTARSRNLLAGRPYRIVMRSLAVLLAAFAILLLLQGFQHLAEQRVGDESAPSFSCV